MYKVEELEEEEVEVAVTGAVEVLVQLLGAPGGLNITPGMLEFTKYYSRYVGIY